MKIKVISAFKDKLQGEVDHWLGKVGKIEVVASNQSSEMTLRGDINKLDIYITLTIFYKPS